MEESKAVVASQQQKEASVLAVQEQLLMRVNEVKNAGSYWLFLADHVDNWEVLNCQGTQEFHRGCNLKAELSQVKAKWPCGCEGMLLQCWFVVYIDFLQKNDAAVLQSLSEGKLGKYRACFEATCANPMQLYEYSQIYQSWLRQFLNDKTILPHFSTNPRPYLAPDAHQALRQWAANADSLIYDNSDELKEQIKNIK